MDSDAYKAGKIPVDTDNILGVGNFTRTVIEMDPNVCRKCHPWALGAYSFPCQWYALLI
jgi:hypothetical protein